MPTPEYWERSTARTARSLPPRTGKRVPLVSRAPKIVLPRRLNKHGTRQDEVRLHRAAAPGARARHAHAVRKSRARDARPARRGPDSRGPPADAGPRRDVPQMAHPRLPHVRGRRDRRRALQRAARDPGVRARHRDLLPVRAPPAAVLRPGARRLPAERAAGRSLQDSARDRSVRPPAAGAGAAHRSGGGRAHGSARPARRGCGDRGVPPLHDDARRREAELQDGHERLTGRAAPGREDPGRIPAAGLQPGPGVSDASPTALAGKLALVTGASRGIGLAVAELLHTAGAHVVRLARTLVDGTADRRTDLRCDVTDPAAVDRAVGRVLTDRGVPDIVVNNAGIFFIKPVAETTPDDFTRTIAVNLMAPFLVTRALVPHLVRRGSGHFVTIGSISDHVAFTGSTAYAASKFGLRGMHEVLRAELSRTGVRTTLVSPGPVDTPMWDPIDPDAQPGFTKRSAMLQAGDVAEAVLFAVTRAARVDVTEIRLLPTVYTLRG